MLPTTAHIKIVKFGGAEKCDSALSAPLFLLRLVAVAIIKA
jgi:hypothetical protein